MEGVESKSQSPGEDTQNMPENSVYLAEIVEGSNFLERFQQCVKETLDLIEQDDNFSQMTPEVDDSKKSRLTTLITISSMHMALADQNVHLVKEFSKNTDEITTPIKTQHVGSSTSTSPQVTNKIMTPVGYDFTLDISGGVFNICTREGSETSLTLSSNSESESSMSINKHLKSPINHYASKVKETKVHDPEVLLNKMSTLEKEQISLKKKIKNLTDKNALLEAEKANVPELKHMLSESNRKIETMEKVLEASKKQVSTAEGEYSKMVKEMSSKVFGKVVNTLEKQSLIEKKDEQITELNTDINQLKISHAADLDRLNTEINQLKTSHAVKVGRLNTEMERVKKELREKYELMEDLKNLLQS